MCMCFWVRTGRCSKVGCWGNSVPGTACWLPAVNQLHTWAQAPGRRLASYCPTLALPQRPPVHLRAVGKVAKLRLPDDQGVGVLNGVACQVVGSPSNNVSTASRQWMRVGPACTPSLPNTSSRRACVLKCENRPAASTAHTAQSPANCTTQSLLFDHEPEANQTLLIQLKAQHALLISEPPHSKHALTQLEAQHAVLGQRGVGHSELQQQDRKKMFPSLRKRRGAALVVAHDA